MKTITKLLVASRGEISFRIIRSSKELGIPCVSVSSTADGDALYVPLADEAVCIGDAPSPRRNLSIPHLLAACTITNADAVHPGYSFLSENAEFADICASMGITFIGPSSNSITRMGDKATAKLKDFAQARELAGKMGYLVKLKATAGGGGRGIKTIPSTIRKISTLP